MLTLLTSIIAQVVANLANFAYDPRNYSQLHQLHVADLFFNCVREAAAIWSVLGEVKTVYCISTAVLVVTQKAYNLCHIYLWMIARVFK